MLFINTFPKCLKKLGGMNEKLVAVLEFSLESAEVTRTSSSEMLSTEIQNASDPQISMDILENTIAISTSFLVLGLR